MIPEDHHQKPIYRQLCINNLKILRKNCYLDLEFRSELNLQLNTGCLMLLFP